jgi:hypothetical protein
MNDELVLGHAILRYTGHLTVKLVYAPLIVNSSSQSLWYIGYSARVSMELHNLGQNQASHPYDKVMPVPA